MEATAATGAGSGGGARAAVARDRGRISQAGEIRSASIESLRALAALAVLLGHVFGTAYNYNFAYLTSSLPKRVLFGGGAGVFLFFALTGYLLFWPFVRRDYAGGDPIKFGRYALNRALRILPLYYVVLFVFMLTNTDPSNVGTWWRFGIFSENFFTSTIGKVDGPMWSLVVEVHFYILLPLLAYALARLSARKRIRAAAILLVLGLASMYLHWRKVDNIVGAPDLRWEYSLPATFGFFVPGMLLALLRSSWQERRPALLTGVLGRSDVWLGTAVVLWVLAVDNFHRTPLCAVAAFFTLGACVLGLRAGVGVRALTWRPLAVLGVASYSLYLWHLPIVEWLHPSPAAGFWSLLAISVPLCIAVALISYRAVEEPFLRLRRRWTTSTAAPGPQPLSAAAAPAAVAEARA